MRKLLIIATCAIALASCGDQEIDTLTYHTISMYRRDDPKIDAAIDSAMEDGRISERESDDIFDKIHEYNLTEARRRLLPTKHE